MAVLLRDNVYQMIRRAILTCEFRPGQELREQILAEKYRVSRSPVRDSLLRLEQENLVTVLPRQGYRVNPISLRDVEDAFGLRMIIEPACAAEAAKAVDDAVQKLTQFKGFICDDRQKANFLDYNRAFHRAVADLANNKRIAEVEYALVEEFDRLVWAGVKVFGDDRSPDPSTQHDAIIDAIQAHDANAAHRLAQEHVAAVRSRIIAALRLLETPQDSPAAAMGDSM